MMAKLVDAVHFKNTKNADLLFGSLSIVGAVGGLFAFTGDRPQFFHSFLVSFVFFLTIALGCMFFVLINHLTRAGWSVAVRRIPESAAMTLGLFLPLFVVVFLGKHELYHWTHAEVVAHDPVLQHKAAYLNEEFFAVRAIVYFLVWALIANFFYRSSIKQDGTGDPRTTVSMQTRAAPAMVLFAFTVSFMAFDWIMSLDPHWFSTIFGVYIFSGSALAGMAFITIVGMYLRTRGILSRTIQNSHFRDLGRWQFAFSVFWAYIAFSQYFLIWYGNMPEETIFYLHRLEGNWKAFSYFLAFGHFAVPFAALMSQWVKSRPGLIVSFSVWILLMHLLDMIWLVMPNLQTQGWRFTWIDVVCFVFVGAVFLGAFVRFYGSQALAPVGDPRFNESLKLQNEY